MMMFDPEFGRYLSRSFRLLCRRRFSSCRLSPNMTCVFLLPPLEVQVVASRNATQESPVVSHRGLWSLPCVFNLNRVGF